MKFAWFKLHNSGGRSILVNTQHIVSIIEAFKEPGACAVRLNGPEEANEFFVIGTLEEIQCEVSE